MKRIIYTILALLLISVSAYAGGPKRYVLGFYNVENLFDTHHDSLKRDEDFLPEGRYRWTPSRYCRTARTSGQSRNMKRNFTTSPRSSRLWQMRIKPSIQCWDSVR